MVNVDTNDIRKRIIQAKADYGNARICNEVLAYLDTLENEHDVKMSEYYMKCYYAKWNWKALLCNDKDDKKICNHTGIVCNCLTCPKFKPEKEGSIICVKEDPIDDELRPGRLQHAINITNYALDLIAKEKQADKEQSQYYKAKNKEDMLEMLEHAKTRTDLSPSDQDAEIRQLEMELGLKQEPITEKKVCKHFNKEFKIIEGFEYMVCKDCDDYYARVDRYDTGDYEEGEGNE